MNKYRQQIEKIAGLKRMQRIMEAEAKASKPRLYDDRVYADLGTYKKEMAENASAIKKHRKVNKGLDLSSVLLTPGKNSAAEKFPDKSGLSAVNELVQDKYNANYEGYTHKQKEAFFSSPTNKSLVDENARPRFGLADKVELDQHKDELTLRGERRRKLLRAENNVNSKIQNSGVHKNDMISVNDIAKKGKNRYYRGVNAHKTGVTGVAESSSNPAMWAAKDPRVANSYGSNLIEFKPNQDLTKGATPFNHPHLAEDTRGLKNRKAPGLFDKVQHMNRTVNDSIHAKGNYERVLNDNNKALNKSIKRVFTQMPADKGVTPNWRHLDNDKVMRRLKPNALQAKALAGKVDFSQIVNMMK